VKQYLSKVQEIERFFERVQITRMPREDSTQTDSLARLGWGTNEEIEALGQQVQTMNQPSITQPVNVMLEQAAEIPEWVDKVFWYLNEGKLPEDKKKPR
jgi:hypothetical protein